MENCLVTKLKGTVDNESLLKLGSIRVSVHVDTDFPDARPYIFINAAGVSSVPTVRIIGDYTFADTGTKVHEFALSGGVYDTNDIVFPNGTYELEISHKYNISNLRLGNNNGGMLIVNHRNDAMVFNVEDLAYSSGLMGFMYVYQDVYGDVHTLAEKGFISKVNTIRLSACSKINGTLKDLCVLGSGVFNGSRTDTNRVAIELKEGGSLKTAITGSILEAIDYVKDIAVANTVLRLDIGGNTTLDKSGIELPSAATGTYTFTFDGNGSYTVVGE